MAPFGTADVGRPLHLFTMGKKEGAQLTLLVNNAIHPGEPRGVNASIAWATDLLDGGTLPDGVHIAIVPMYNVGGGLRRNCCTRATPERPGVLWFPRKRPEPRPEPGFHQMRQPQRVGLQRHVRFAFPDVLVGHPHLQWRGLPRGPDLDCQPTRQTRRRPWPRLEHTWCPSSMPTWPRPAPP